MGVERFDITQEDASGSYSLSGWYTFSDTTGVIQRLDWDNTFPYDLAITFSHPGKADVTTILRALRGGFRGNVPGNYTHQGLTFQMGPA